MSAKLKRTQKQLFYQSTYEKASLNLHSAGWDLRQTAKGSYDLWQNVPRIKRQYYLCCMIPPVFRTVFQKPSYKVRLTELCFLSWYLQKIPNLTCTAHLPDAYGSTNAKYCSWALALNSLQRPKKWKPFKIDWQSGKLMQFYKKWEKKDQDWDEKKLWKFRDGFYIVLKIFWLHAIIYSVKSENIHFECSLE